MKYAIALAACSLVTTALFGKTTAVDPEDYVFSADEYLFSAKGNTAANCWVQTGENWPIASKKADVFDDDLATRTLIGGAGLKGLGFLSFSCLWSLPAFNAYSIALNGQNYSTPNRAPKAWRIWGMDNSKWESDETAEWTLVDERSDETEWSFSADQAETRFYVFRKPAKFSRFKLEILANNGHDQYTAIHELHFYSVRRKPEVTAADFEGLSDLVSTSKYNDPSITSDFTLKVGRPDCAFDDFADNTSGNYRCLFTPQATSPYANIIKNFGADDRKIVNAYSITTTASEWDTPARSPRVWKFYGSDTGAADDWTLLDTRDEEVDWAKSETRYYQFANYTPYAFYKIEFDANNGDATYLGFHELQFFCRPRTPDVYFAKKDLKVVDGRIVLDLALAFDSVPAKVSAEVVRNGAERAVFDLGTLEPNGTFSQTVAEPGAYFVRLTATKEDGSSVVETLPPAWLPAAGESAVFVMPEPAEGAYGLISEAVAALGEDGGTVYVLPGSYAEPARFTGVTLDKPVAVVGLSGDPADAVVARPASVDLARVFKLDHAGAVIRNLTVRDGLVNREGGNGTDTSLPRARGGNVWVTVNGGLVDHCVLENGSTVRVYNGPGGNIALDGGRATRCQFVGGATNQDNDTGLGGCVYGEGTAVIENCLVRDCRGPKGVPVFLKDSARLVSCTVAGNVNAACAGVVVHGVACRVVNCAFYGNSGAPNELANVVAPFFNASAAAKERYLETLVGCAAPVALNDACRVVEEPGFKDAANGDYALADDSPLRNKVAPAAYAESGAVSALDLAGNPRQVGRTIDIGCYESTFKPASGSTLIFR